MNQDSEGEHGEEKRIPESEGKPPKEQKKEPQRENMPRASPAVKAGLGGWS